MSVIKGPSVTDHVGITEHKGMSRNKGIVYKFATKIFDILLESGDNLLLETGDKIKQEG